MGPEVRTCIGDGSRARTRRRVNKRNIRPKRPGGKTLIPGPLLYTLCLLPAACSQPVDESGCLPPLACCEEDCCGNGTSFSWDAGACLLDPYSGGFNGTHSAEYDPRCVVRRCCENECCGAGSEYDGATGYCLPAHDDTKVLFAQLLFLGMSRKFNEAEIPVAASVFRETYNDVASRVGVDVTVLSVVIIDQTILEVIEDSDVTRELLRRDIEGERSKEKERKMARGSRTKQVLWVRYKAVVRCSACEHADNLMFEDTVNIRRELHDNQGTTRRLFLTSSQATSMQSLFPPEYVSNLQSQSIEVGAVKAIACADNSECPSNALFCDNYDLDSNWECSYKYGFFNRRG